MDQTRALISDVVQHITRFLIVSESVSLEEWKQSLSYLAISQIWREAGKPMLYAHAIITFHENNRRTGGYDTWPGVRVIRINVETAPWDTCNKPTAAEVMAVFQKLPNIMRLWLFYPAEADKSGWLCDKIVNYYMHQLTCIETNCGISFLDSNFLTQLKVFDIPIRHDCVLQLPYNCPDNMHNLSIHQLSHNFSWRYFQHNSALDIVEFTNLRVLAINFANDAPTNYDSMWDGQPANTRRIYTLQLPNVASIRITNCLPNIELAQPDSSMSLKDFTFVGSVAALARCCNVQLSSAQNIDVFISATSAFDDDVCFYKATNMLFGGKAQLQCAKVVISELSFMLRPHQTSWTSLKSLRLATAIEFKPLLQLIYRLPSLAELTVEKIKLVTDLDDDAFAQLYSELRQILQKPLDTKIMQLQLGFEGNPGSASAGRIYLSMMIQIESLVSLKVQKKYINAATEFKAMAPLQYAHIDNITIELFD